MLKVAEKNVSIPFTSLLLIFMLVSLIVCQDEEKTYGFELPSEAASKHLENCCRDQQTFFSLALGKDSCTPGRDAGSRIIGLSQRFRNSLSGGRRAIASREQRSPDPNCSQKPVVRIPSRRYQRRFGQQAEAYSETGSRSKSLPAAHPALDALPHSSLCNKENYTHVPTDFPQIISEDISSATHSRSSVMAIGMERKSAGWANADQG